MNRNRNPHLRLEQFEDRCTPTVTIVNPTTATFIEPDGDRVTIRVSMGILDAGMFDFDQTVTGDWLQKIDLTGGGFSKANLSIVSTPGPAQFAEGDGDGLVNGGVIDATGVDLGNVIVDGDLGRMTAGNPSAEGYAIGTLKVRSIGRIGTDPQAPGSVNERHLKSEIKGAIRSLEVTGDVVGARFVVDDVASVIQLPGRVVIGGSIIGLDDDE